uniref:helix-turn-helix domain-containing protein n=1 Tax=Agathobacter sp. TaxID=2021311 RepID=UPI003FED7E9F
MGIERELSYRMFHQREELLEHVGYEEEARLYFAVATGDISLVKEYAQNYMKPDASGNEKNGILSRDPLQNTKYHFVIFTALITRLCVEYGMIREEAYTISDLYINKMDVCNNSQKILYLQGEMLLDFTTRMAALEKKANYPIPIAQAIDYINNHLQEPLSLNKIASILGLTPSYLSYLFKKETGTTIKKYILEKKLKAAETMLLYSDMSSSDIAGYFNFASQSYFISCFKKATGQTPLEYRQHHYQTYTKPVHDSPETL